MLQTKRHESVVELINDLDAGAPLPAELHHGARFYFPRAVNAAAAARCIVCNVQLIGQQRLLCSGHWDWVQFEPFEEFDYEMNPRISIIEFLQIHLSNTFIVTQRRSWPAVLKEDAHCEVCGRLTDNVEQLWNRYATILKSHVVCPEHQTFRWEDGAD